MCRCRLVCVAVCVVYFFLCASVCSCRFVCVAFYGLVCLIGWLALLLGVCVALRNEMGQSIGFGPVTAQGAVWVASRVAVGGVW